ncbi:hypothetical protein [Methylotuvimicrobium sp. KM1]|uniref:hypothetical protein n=1 Tax=Methylotuvimicrobium sp. KM1 TaxID=3377707 RepID=UPI00384F52F6
MVDDLNSGIAMKTKGKTKSERHHWWPECVSKHWKNANGKVHWILPNGEIRIAPPKNFGCIGNGHYIKLGKNEGETTAWDQNFEPIFDKADNGFPKVISWLQSLTRKDVWDAKTLTDRFIPENASDNQFAQLVESIVSLAIRSPMHRESSVGLAEELRGTLPERERNALINLNMRDNQKKAVSSIGIRGKFVVLYSPSCEFVYGDGFFHNLDSHSPKILAPITPEISVLYTRPLQYISEPRLFTFVTSREETKILNDVVQVYSRNCIFYRSERPTIISEYTGGKHLCYASTENPIDMLISSIPGIVNRQFNF